MRYIIIAILVGIAIIALGAIGLAFSPSDNDAVDSVATPTAQDTCLTTYLSASAAATAALARADAGLARSLDGLLAADDDASSRNAIATATAARVSYDEATAVLADVNGAFLECARIAN